MKHYCASNERYNFACNELEDGRLELSVEEYVTFVKFCPFCGFQPKHSERENLDCCKEVKEISDIWQASTMIKTSFCYECCDCDEYPDVYRDGVEKFLWKLKEQAKMRCSEHCGNTVRDK